MNVAKNVADAGAVEAHHARTSRLIKAKIKAFPLEEREHIMKKRIMVGEFHHRANRHDQNMRFETFALLHQPKSSRGTGLAVFGRSVNRRQPDDCSWKGCLAKTTRAFQFNSPMHCGLRPRGDE